MIINDAGKPGDLRKLIILVDDMDVTEAVVSAHIFQDMFAPVNTAVLNFNDTNNLLMNLPIQPGSRLQIELATDFGSDVGDGEQSWDFVIYRIADRQMENSKQMTYSVYAADRSMFRNQSTRVRKSFSGKKVSDIVKSIYSEHLQATVDVEDTDNTTHVVVPGWTPFYTAAWCQRVALKNGAADYVLFQNPDQSYSFKTYETLFSSDDEKSDITFIVRPTNIRDKSGNSLYDHAVTINKYFFEHFDALTNLAGGFYKSQLVRYDMIEKKWETKDFTLGDDSPDDKEAYTYDADIFGSSGESNISFLPMHKGIASKPTHLDDADSWLLSRKSALQKFSQEKLVIQLIGSARSAEWFGKNCMVDVPAQDFESEEEFDVQRRGRYLITAVAHMINKTAYVINCELVKKRLETE